MNLMALEFVFVFMEMTAGSAIFALLSICTLVVIGSLILAVFLNHIFELGQTSKKPKRAQLVKGKTNLQWGGPHKLRVLRQRLTPAEVVE